jgi:hypothetical protein
MTTEKEVEKMHQDENNNNEDASTICTICCFFTCLIGAQWPFAFQFPGNMCFLPERLPAPTSHRRS